MDAQTLHKANAIQRRIEELEKNLSGIERLEDGLSKGDDFKMLVSAGDDERVKIKYEFLPIDVDQFLSDYKGYLIKELDRQKDDLAII